MTDDTMWRNAAGRRSCPECEGAGTMGVGDPPSTCHTCGAEAYLADAEHDLADQGSDDDAQDD